MLQAELVTDCVNLIDFAKLDPSRRGAWLESLNASRARLEDFIRRLRGAQGVDQTDAADRAEPADVHQVTAAVVALAGEPAGYRSLIAPYHVSWGGPNAAADGWLTYYEAQYRETKNPVFAWEALNLVMVGGGVSMPEWLTDYFYRASTRLHDMSRTNIPQDEMPSAVYRALEFPSQRGNNPFRAITDVAHDFAIALDVWLHLRQGEKLEFAVVDVARDHPRQCGRSPKCESISGSTVARHWQKHGPVLTKQAPRPDPQTAREG